MRVVMVSNDQKLGAILTIALADPGQLSIVESPRELPELLKRGIDAVVLDLPAESRRRAYDQVRERFQGRLLVRVDSGNDTSDWPDDPNRRFLVRPFQLAELVASVEGAGEPGQDPASRRRFLRSAHEAPTTVPEAQPSPGAAPVQGVPPARPGQAGAAAGAVAGPGPRRPAAAKPAPTTPGSGRQAVARPAAGQPTRATGGAPGQARPGRPATPPGAGTTAKPASGPAAARPAARQPTKATGGAPAGARPGQPPTPAGARPGQPPTPAGARPGQPPTPAGAKPGQPPTPAGAKPGQPATPVGGSASAPTARPKTTRPRPGVGAAAGLSREAQPAPGPPRAEPAIPSERVRSAMADALAAQRRIREQAGAGAAEAAPRKGGPRVVGAVATVLVVLLVGIAAGMLIEPDRPLKASPAPAPIVKERVVTRIRPAPASCIAAIDDASAAISYLINKIRDERLTKSLGQYEDNRRACQTVGR